MAPIRSCQWETLAGAEEEGEEKGFFPASAAEHCCANDFQLLPAILELAVFYASQVLAPMASTPWVVLAPVTHVFPELWVPTTWRSYDGALSLKRSK
jgi:hypothetical protein